MSAIVKKIKIIKEISMAYECHSKKIKIIKEISMAYECHSKNIYIYF